MLGKLIRAYRAHHEMGMREFSEKYAIPIATLSRIERGKPMSAATMLKLIRWLFE
jgi:transcriptional regulator with XRE-family HTH domain